MAAPDAPSPSRSLDARPLRGARRRRHARAELAGGQGGFFDWDKYSDIVPGDRPRFPPEREDLLHRRGVHPRLRARCSPCCAACPGPVFFPIRALAIAYADFFRGVPTILVIALLGFGAPALAIEDVPTSTTFWGIVSLVLVYTAYVSEVYRAGIESVHPSQEAAARSLGLTRGQALTSVVLPQAVRRVIPPLLNDFIGLQKDTALVGILGVGRGVQAVADRGRRRPSTSRTTSSRRRSSSRSRSRSPASRTGSWRATGAARPGGIA